ncbi:hemolysin III family protein [Defluviimonas sp. D31]|uniref:PAQR family membrane homeostasis protein TrhA n=1 Tax=Defluviimonas sp. D31 TaxID=3083253 RepID=UPI00296F9DA0|nr:hemolysin III family protein [Defluviimonas sp. D31]MDW4549599.1 hemolysin III family protein [Defluviimonas sp. D31]
MALLETRDDYSRAERFSDAVIHASGLLFVLIAVPVLITVTAFLRGDFTALFGVSVYGLTLIAMILCSALYNLVPHPDWEGLLKRLDHSAIYAKIAGTYTPFTLLSGGHGAWLLAGIWGAAVAGIGLKIIAPDRFHRMAICLYIAMGWAGLFAGSSFLAALSWPVLILILIGGGLYMAGVVFYLFDRLPFHYTIWHVFVLTASLVFYAAVTVHVVQGAA